MNLHIIYLIGETDTETEQNTANDQHPDLDGGGIEDGAGAEEDTAEEHGEFPAELAGDSGGHERRQQSRQVERRREHRQRLTVVLAILVCRLPRHLPPVHRRKKLLQKRVHRRHTT